MGALKKLKEKRWFQAVMKVAPTFATALGGPFAGLALQAAKDALGIEPTEEALEAAVEKDPTILLKIKEIEANWKLRMKELDISEQDLYLKDVQDARAREIAVKDHMPAVMSLFGISLWLLILVTIFFIPELEILSQERRDVLLYLLGATQGMAVAGVQYYLGSSRGSKDKSQMFERFMEK